MKNNMKKILLLTGVLCLASVGGVSAYLTDYDKVSINVLQMKELLLLFFLNQLHDVDKIFRLQLLYML